LDLKIASLVTTISSNLNSLDSAMIAGILQEGKNFTTETLSIARKEKMKVNKKNKDKFECYRCQKMGHFAKECENEPQDASGNKSSSKETANFASEQTSSTILFINSGCTLHIVNSKF
jgi:Zinc knuckle